MKRYVKSSEEQKHLYWIYEIDPQTSQSVYVYDMYNTLDRVIEEAEFNTEDSGYYFEIYDEDQEYREYSSRYGR